MSQFPRVQELIPQLPEDHYAAGLKLSDPIVPALEYFLSLDQVPGFAEKLEALKRKPVGPATTNARTVQWASLCAELGGITLFGKTLNLPIRGLDQQSPRRLRADSDCDVVVLLDGLHTLVEIKRRASEDTQCLPTLLEERLTQLQRDLPYDLSVKMQNREYDCSDLESQLAAIKEWVETFRRLQEEGVFDAEDQPGARGGPFLVRFFPKSTSQGQGLVMDFDPDCAETLKPYLLGPGELGRDGRPMVPMVKQALEKGADYLLCRASPSNGWNEIVEGCFSRVTWTTARTCIAPDADLGALRGVVLFARYDDFCIVNNPSAEGGSWIVA